MSLVCAVSRSARSGLSRTASFSLGSQISTGFRNEKLRPNQFRAFTTNRPTGPVSSGVRGPQPPPPPPPGNSGPQTGGGSGTFAKEITDATFSRDVVQASMRTPVIVDCHADWCHPCKQLRPVLEKEVKARGGFSLVTIDIDKNPNIAQALQVTELPTVMAVFQGKAVDVFVGALPPAEVSKWFTRVCAKLGMKPNPAANGESMEQVLKKAFDMAEQGDIDQAAELLGAVLKDEELAKAHSPAAKAGIIVCSIGRGDFSGARSVAADVRQNHKDNLNMPLVKRALAMVDVLPSDGVDEQSLTQQAASDPANLEVQLELAKLRFRQKKYDDAVNTALAIIQKDKSWKDGAARVALVQMFNALGDTHTLAVSGRRRLGNLLFS